MFKLNANQLKLMAVIGMITSHMVIAWWEIIPIWLAFPMYIAGGLTFPIMAYFVAEGYKHTSNHKRYILRVLLFGLLALPFHILVLTIPMGGGNPMLYPFFNIMFNIVASLLVLTMYDKMKSKVLFWLLFVLVIAPLSLVILEWYFVGVAMVLMAHIIKNETARRVVPPVFAAVIFTIIGFFTSAMTTPELAAQFAEAGVNLPRLMNYQFSPVQMTFQIGIVIAAFLLTRYSGERGKRSKTMKWLFYVIYPVHFVVLWLGMLLIRAFV
ncbi:MAG: conjugal transfer protein TraX [Oscillospiraceae bacterium]|nr:conjugal transfer protein TraX [Oscillospiraceae bacterium]